MTSFLCFSQIAIGWKAPISKWDPRIQIPWAMSWATQNLTTQVLWWAFNWQLCGLQISWIIIGQPTILGPASAWWETTKPSRTYSNLKQEKHIISLSVWDSWTRSHYCPSPSFTIASNWSSMNEQGLQLRALSMARRRSTFWMLLCVCLPWRQMWGPWKENQERKLVHASSSARGEALPPPFSCVPCSSLVNGPSCKALWELYSTKGKE